MLILLAHRRGISRMELMKIAKEQGLGASSFYSGLHALKDHGLAMDIPLKVNGKHTIVTSLRYSGSQAAEMVSKFQEFLKIYDAGEWRLRAKAEARNKVCNYTP